jgi:predicted amidohydrolase YtcJ
MQNPAAALAIVNARIWTGDCHRPWADAILVRGERIEIVGSSAEVKKRAGTTVRVVDARGMMVAPGVIDAPVHSLDGIYAAVTRRPLDDARQELGVLAAGRRADLVLIDRDLTRVAPETIRDAQVMLTMVGGSVVFDRAGLAQ